MADELYLINGSTLTDIGNAIRSKTGETSTIQVSNYASKIRNIDAAPVCHTVTFKGMNNETLATYEVKHGEACVYTGKTPVDSSQSYYFGGWDKDTTSVTSDMTLYALSKAVSATTAASYFSYTISGTFYTLTDYTGGAFAVIPYYINGYKFGNVQQGTFDSRLTHLTIGGNGANAMSLNHAFSNCTNLQDVYYCGTKSQWIRSVELAGEDSLADVYTNLPLYLAPRIHTSDGCIINS